MFPRWLFSITGYEVASSITFLTVIGAIAVIVHGATRRSGVGSGEYGNGSDYTLLQSGTSESYADADDTEGNMRCAYATCASGFSSDAVLRPRILVWLRQLILTSISVVESYRIYLIAEGYVKQHRQLQDEEVLALAASAGWLLGLIALLQLDGISSLYHHRWRMRAWLPAYIIIAVHYVIELACNNEAILLVGFTLALMLAAVASIAAHSDWHFKQERPPTAEYTCGLPAALSFSHLNSSIISPGMRKEALDFSDVPPLSDCDSAATVWGQFLEVLHGAALQHIGNAGKDSVHSKSGGSSDARNSRGSGKMHEPFALYTALQSRHSGDGLSGSIGLFRKLWHLVYWEWLAQGCFQLMSSCLTFVAPLALERILVYVGAAGAGAATDSSTPDSAKAQSLLPVSAATAVALLFLGSLLKGVADGQNFVRGR